MGFAAGLDGVDDGTGVALALDRLIFWGSGLGSS